MGGAVVGAGAPGARMRCQLLERLAVKRVVGGLLGTVLVAEGVGGLVL